MKKSEAKRRIKELRDGFDMLFAQDVLEEKSVRAEWLGEAVRLAADIFGNQDDLYERINLAQNLSEAYDREPDDEKKSALGQDWHLTVGTWLDMMTTNIQYGDNIDKTEFQNTKTFVFLYPLFPVILAAILGYFYAQRLADAEQIFIQAKIENENKKELACVMVEFEYWSKGVQVGLADSIEAIAADFVSRGVYNSWGYIKAVHNFALRKRFSLDSARSLRYARISSLGGDTASLNAPRRLGVRVDQSLGQVAKRLDIDISHLRLDTL